ncbi:MAG TPA: ATP-binding protein, partial [Dehalococcoidia bacterium]|nr:ATP-binding protein [Dehalococcoidia bacterium]
MSKAVPYRTAALHTVRRCHLYILLSLFAVCTLFYYFGELVNFAGWTALRREIFYSVHDVHRILFLAPIIYAGYFYRVRGALIVTLAAFLTFLPRALIISPYPDPMLRMVLFGIAAGMVGSLTGVMRNEHDKRSQLELLARTERDKLLKVLEGIEDGVIIIGPDKRIRFANPRMMRDFGEGIGCYCYKYLYNSDDPCEGICRLSSVIDGATERWEYIFQNGRSFDVTASPFVDSDGEACQLTTFRDITQRKQVELELMKLSRLKSELLSNVSHDLRSPLTSIKGAISSLLQKDVKLDNETQQMLLSSVLEETDRLASLVTKLLDMSKLEAGTWEPEKEHCHIADIINEALERQKWIDKKHIFETYLEPDLPEIYADYIQIRQVLVNLLENAAAYSEEGTKITVTAKSMNGEIRVSVSDQGVGIPQEDLAKIFDKFYRGTQKRQIPGGAGLGLAICQTIVISHGGRIWAESEIGRGCA